MSLRCETCGRNCGLEQQRRSWSLYKNIIVPKTGNSDDRPSQITNDLLCHTAVSRNGGTSKTSHICDKCLRIGLRAIKVDIGTLLGDLDGDQNKDSELTVITQRLGHLQSRLDQVCFAHNRMQDRLSDVLHVVDLDTATMAMARWEVNRGHINADES